MPAKNAVKIYEPDSYFHIYNRGAGKQAIFVDTQDKKYFLGLIERHLDHDNTKTNINGVVYQKYDKDVELLAYCLMGNHFHMFAYVGDDTQKIVAFMKSICTAYTMYFNKKYRRSGSLFQGVYKASHITEDTYLIHVSRYIHMNPRNYLGYKFSSIGAYLGGECPNWLKIGRILELHENGSYLEFMQDYESHKEWLDEIHKSLAG
jgi:putative transposase